MRMTCGIKEHHAYHMNSSDVQWYFKPCGGGFHQMACSNRAELDEHDWHPLNCGDKRCHVTLTVQNASEADAGLYRCTIHPYRTDNQTQLDIQLVRTFQLIVTKSFLDESIPAPELLDNLPANTTAIVDTQIVLQCRVHSKVQPTIKWFRRINKQLGEHSFNQNKSIRYLENFYELLPSAGEKLLSHDVYLSKLILYSASERDIGIYVCVGINYGGVSMADAYVNLLHANGTPMEESHGGYVDLMVLFLIPVALALVPLVAWIVLNVLRASHHPEEKGLVSLNSASIYEPAITAQSDKKDANKERKTITRSNHSPSERFSNITRRTKTRRTENLPAVKQNETAKQRHTISIVDCSIISLDGSTNDSGVALKSQNPPNPTQTRRRATRTKAGAIEPQTNAIEMSTENVQTRRSNALKRKQESSVPDTGVSPPKKVLEDHVSIVEISVDREEGTAQEIAEHQTIEATVSTTTTHIQSVPKPDGNASKKLPIDPFKALIVSVKRVGPALTETELKSLKYYDPGAPKDAMMNDNHRQSALVTEIDASLERHSSERNRNVSERKRRFSRLSLSTKPQIIVSAPTTESSLPADRSETDTNGNRLLPPGGKKEQKKIKPSPLSYAIEEEDIGEDVYEFQSCSQTSETLGKSKVRKKPGRKPKPKTGAAKPAKKKKPVATVGKSTVSWKPGHNNPFGCNRKQLANVIKHIGGGPVKPPVTVDYVVNLELPATPQPIVDRGGRGENDRDEIIDLPYQAPPVVPKHPTVEKLKYGSALLQQPQTSTPMNKPTEPAPTPPSNPVSPWRLQDDNIIIPRTSYVPRNKEMLPSYDSFFAVEDNNGSNAPPTSNAPVSLVTERRKPPSGARQIAPTLTDRSFNSPASNSQVNDKEMRELERMYLKLQAKMEMSKRLINSLRRNKAIPGLQNCPEHRTNVKEACLKMKQWYKDSKKDFHRSLHIVNKIHRANVTGQTASCPSPLTTDQQRTVECFNQSSDRFRTMIDEMQAVMNDSNVENCSPPSSPKQAKPSSSSSLQQPSQQPSKVSDVIILPARLTHGATRNPLMPLNFVPLPQRTSPLISPLAVADRGIASAAKETAPVAGENNIRRKLEYENTNKERQEEQERVTKEPPATDTAEHTEPESNVLEDVNHSAHPILDVGANEVVKDGQLSTADSSASIDNCFGFDEDERSQESTQVTLPLPANISSNTLKQSLAKVRQFIPKQPIFRQQPKPTPSTSGGGPTRLPTVKLRVFGSPTRRPSHTLREFVASTPRAELSQLAATANTPSAGPSKGTQLLAVERTPHGQHGIALEAPDISAIERLNTTVPAKQHPNDGNEPEVVLFDTPEESHIDRSTLHRTYARVPRRRRKNRNIYLANLGLDDDEDDEDDEGEGDAPEPVDSDSDFGSGNTRKKKDRTKKPRRKPKPVEETAAFKQYVETFNNMYERVQRFEPIIE
ncbi:hypothetical protein ZHAS_00005603 [Anopheles sinensis]|uniref:receptor protein-tyrosine kinase n=1 Tax=Anopheles sinensis TaxID=74873 RepID=A0A084VJX9_ANOSI|nr:hypothetical protein ZHAS_00005603 [Anopheles sinensis]